MNVMGLLSTKNNCVLSKSFCARFEDRTAFDNSLGIISSKALLKAPAGAVFATALGVQTSKMEKRDKLIGFLFSDIARFRGIVFENLMRPHGLTHAQAYVLNQLFLEDGLTQTELASRMKVGTVTVSGLVDRLEARGWVKRFADTRDRRAKKVWLTEDTSGLLQHMVREFSNMNDISVDGLSEGEVTEMTRMLRKVRANLASKVP